MSSNALGRAQVLADLLQPRWSVRIIGPRLGNAIWVPARNDGRVQGSPVRNVGELAAFAARLPAVVRRDDLLVISKPLPTSLGLAAPLARVLPRSLLDIDDWEVGLQAATKSSSLMRTTFSEMYSCVSPFSFNTAFMTRQLESVARQWPTRVVSNDWLSSRFGGDVIYHVRDPSHFVVSDAVREATRCELGLGTRHWVTFAGTIRPHKGVDLLIEAVRATSIEGGAGLLLLGVDSTTRHNADAIACGFEALGHERFRVVRRFPQKDLPRYLAASDIIAIPSRSGPESCGQMPAKLFDAMHAGKPIVATDVCDVRKVLGDTGTVVRPDSVSDLKGAIEELIRDTSAAIRMGARARARAASTFDLASARTTLWRVIDGMA